MRSSPWRALAPDWVTFIVLAAITLALFWTVRLPPDLRSGQTAPPADVAAAPPAHVQDFAFVFNYARRAAEQPGVSPYTADAHRAFFQAWLGPRVRSALCFPYGFAAVVLLAPLFPLVTRWAWLVWNLTGSWLGAWVVRVRSDGAGPVSHWDRLGMISPSAFHTLVNGQTALVTTGCFAAVAHLGRDARSERPASVLGCAVCILALTVKPPLAGMAAVALLLAGRLRSVLAAGALTGLSVLVASAWWTPRVVADYAVLLARYNLVDADEIFRAGCVPQRMDNLRSLLLHTGWLDDSQAFFVSGYVLAFVLIATLATLFRRPRRPWPLDLAVSWVVTLYLLFAPHLSPTEDLLLVVPLTTLLRCGPRDGWRRALGIAGCLGPQWINASAIQLAVGSGDVAFAPIAAFLLKLVPASMVFALARREGALSYGAT